MTEIDGVLGGNAHLSEVPRVVNAPTSGVTRVVNAPLPTKYGDFRAFGLKSNLVVPRRLQTGNRFQAQASGLKRSKVAGDGHPSGSGNVPACGLIQLS